MIVSSFVLVPKPPITTEWVSGPVGQTPSHLMGKHRQEGESRRRTYLITLLSYLLFLSLSFKSCPKQIGLFGTLFSCEAKLAPPTCSSFLNICTLKMGSVRDFSLLEIQGSFKEKETMTMCLNFLLQASEGSTKCSRSLLFLPVLYR